MRPGLKGGYSRDWQFWEVGADKQERVGGRQRVRVVRMRGEREEGRREGGSAVRGSRVRRGGKEEEGEGPA